MKTLTTLCTLFLCCTAMAENNGHNANQGFLNAAKEYDAKAQRAASNGNTENAKIFKRLAEIKREAAVSTNGYDWSEYHKLSGQLKSNHKSHKGKKAKHTKSAQKENGFEGAAQRYDKLAKAAKQAGNSEKAAIYSRLAAIKREAQKSGGNYDWSEYHKLSAQLNQGKKHHHKEKPVKQEKVSHKEEPAKQEKAPTPKVAKKTESLPTDFIATAQKHAALANTSNASNDAYSAQIHTRLAAILIDAAARQSENRTIDWTEYKELKELLGK